MNNEKLNKISEEMKTKQIKAIKDIVALTFEQIRSLEHMRNKIQEELKILKHDIFDLKDGRLDKVLERQRIDSDNKRVSMFEVDLKAPAAPGCSPWYIEYEIKYNTPDGPVTLSINNSVTKMHASGCYKLTDGSIENL